MVVEDMEANQKTDLLLGTNYGLMALYKLHPRQSPDQPLWHPLKTWNLINPIKNLLFMRVDVSTLLLITLGEGSVLIIQFPNKDNPERASPKNFVNEVCSGQNTYTLVACDPHSGTIAAVNGNGRFCIFYSIHCQYKSIEAGGLDEKLINKRPVFIEFLGRDDVVVVGCSDGCVYFISRVVSNCFRFEEPPQAYAINKATATLCIVAQNSVICLYSSIRFLCNKVPNFARVIEEHLTEIRRLTGDYETSADLLLRTYLYMPLSN